VITLKRHSFLAFSCSAPKPTRTPKIGQENIFADRVVADRCRLVRGPVAPWTELTCVVHCTQARIVVDSPSFRRICLQALRGAERFVCLNQEGGEVPQTDCPH
jgi:hypothetical protein